MPNSVNSYVEAQNRMKNNMEQRTKDMENKTNGCNKDIQINGEKVKACNGVRIR